MDDGEGVDLEEITRLSYSGGYNSLTVELVRVDDTDIERSFFFFSVLFDPL